MSEERLRRAAGALERSVAEVDVLERLEALGRRRRRQRSTTVLAVLVAVAVFGGAALGLRMLRTTDPVAGPLPADPATPARVVAALPVYGDPTAVAVNGTTDLGPTPAKGIPNGVAAGHGSVWVAGADVESLLRLAPG